ncbi:unnamed protein product [Calicophoron daubneyi]
MFYHAQPVNGVMGDHAAWFKRQDLIGDLLEDVLTGKLKHDIQFTPLTGGYLLIDEILLIPEFKQQNCTYEDVVEVIHSDEKLRFSIRGSKVRLKPPELNADRDIIISKKLSCVLRHGAVRHGLVYQLGGYLFLDDILHLELFDGISEADVRRVVENNNKRRYELVTDTRTGRTLIRALQGHSVAIEGLTLTPITDASLYPTVIHGTYFQNWERIKKEGLKRFSRTHIHFAPGEVGDTGVISGMRSSAEVIIYVDLAKALADGYEFFISQNHVILTPGNEEGCLPPKYIIAAYQRYPRVRLPLD